MNRRKAPHRFPFPSDPIVDNTISMFIKSINCYDLESSAEICKLVRHALLRYSAVDKQCRTLIKQSVCLKYYLFFFDCLIERPSVERRFLDGVFDVELFDGSYGAGPKEIERFKSLTPIDVLKDRLKSAKKLSTFDEIQIKTRSGHYMPTDLPEGVCMRVGAFVGRCRLLTQCASTAKTAPVVVCDGCGCNRKMLDVSAGRVKPTVNDLFGANNNESSDEDDDEYVSRNNSWSYPATSYWARILPGTVANLPRRQFCSFRCVKTYEHELSTLIPITAQSLESDECQYSRGKVGLSRVVAVSRASIKRNAAALRALRQSRHAIRRTSVTIDRNLIETIHENVQDMLNIDLALIQAAAAIAESPISANGRLLPGTQPNWRAEVSKFNRAIEIAKSIYVANKCGSRSKAVDEREFPAWLRKIRDAALQMYPCEPP